MQIFFLEHSFLLSQIFAGLTLVCNILAFQRRERREILVLFIAATLSLGVHFYLLHEYTATIMMVVAALRYCCAIFSRSQKLLWSFILLAVVFGALTYHDSVSIIAIMASSVGTYAGFQENDKKLRVWMMLSSVLWITHNLLVFTPAGVILEVLFLASNFLGYYRYYLRRMHW